MKAVAVAALAIFSVASQAADPTTGEITLNGWYDTNVSGGGSFSLTTGLDPSQELNKSFTSNVNGLLWLNFSSSGSGSVGVFANTEAGSWNYDINLLSGLKPDTQFNAGAHSYSFSVTNHDSYLVYLTNPGTSSLTFSKMGIGSVAAVPEPETYAMLLAGLGVMGFVGRRRMRQA
ncbi:MAG: FxDxF family PEP-CTERM protein [Leptothrix sp. (in: b-proteobacteria)]